MVMGTRFGGDTQSGEGSTGSTGDEARSEGVEEIRSVPIRRSRKEALAIGLREVAPSLAVSILAVLVAGAFIVVTILGVTGVWGGTPEPQSCADVARQLAEAGAAPVPCVEAPDDPSPGVGEGP